MAKKGFKGGIDSLLSETQKKRGRPKVNNKPISKSSQIGTREGETRATFIMSERLLDDVKAMAYSNHVAIKDILQKALEEFFSKRKAKLEHARADYKNKGKEQI